MAEILYTLHQSPSGRTLTLEVDGDGARLRIDAPGMSAMSMPVEATDLIEAAGALSAWALEQAGEEAPP